MNFYADSNYIHAKIYALHGLLLTRSDYYDIVKNSNLHSVISGLEAYDIKTDSTVVKEKIFESQVHVVMGLAGASAATRWIFILFLRYFELLNLKLLCARAFGRSPSPCIWYNIGDTAVLGRELPAVISGMDAVIRCTESTWMNDVFESGDVTSFEDAERMADIAVLRLALDFVKTLNPADRKAGRKLVSGLMAYLGLSWGSRLRTVYGMNEVSVSDYVGSVMPSQAHDPLIRKHANEWERKLLKNSAENQTNGLTAAEKTMERNIMRHICRMFHTDFHSTNTVACYLVLLHRQIINLFSIVDGLRFGIAADIIMGNIICEE